MAQKKMTERFVTLVITLVVAGVIGVIGSALVGGALIKELGGVQETEPALAQRVADLELKTDEIITIEVVANIVDTKIGEAIATLTDRVAALETVTIPRGVVVAFDRDDLNADKCPLGWQPFKEARARVIVGAGDPSKAPGKYGHDEAGRRLTHYVRGQHRGEEMVALKVTEMPKHSHPQSNNNYYWIGAGNNPQDEGFSKPGRYEFTTTTKVSAQGGNQPHNNMPPYIALYFCKKD